MNSLRQAAVVFLLLLLPVVVAVGCMNAGSAENGSVEQTSNEPAEDKAEGKDDDNQSAKKKKKKGKGGEEEEEIDPAVPVEVTALVRGPIESVLKSSATLEAEREVKVFAEAARLVRGLLVEEGDRVRRGQVLVRLQDDEQRNALARVQNELAKAEREYTRQQRLYREQLISEEQFNNATFELEQLRISLADAERELGYTEVKAPISGTITQRLVNLGDQVTVGQHLFDIIDFDSLVARIYVPEKHLPELKQGLAARVSARAVGGRDYRGVVDRIAPIVDAKSGTVKVTVEVGGEPGLRPGMYVDVEVVTATREDAILVPKRALVYDNDQMYVFRLKQPAVDAENKPGDEPRIVERVFIRPRLTDKHNIEPLDGLSAGDRIVVAGQAGLKDGAQVRLPGDEPRKKQADEKPADETAERASA